MQDSIRFRNDRTGVSPVIGVILMVAVTVIIAAVIGSTALGLGDSVSETPPRVSFDTEQKDDVTVYAAGRRVGEYSVVEFKLTGGDNVDLSNVELRVNGEKAYDIFETDSTPTDAEHSCASPCHYTTTPSETIQSGDTVRVAVKQSKSGTEIGDLYGFGLSTEDESPLYIQGDEHNPDNVVNLEDGDEISLLWGSGDKSYTLDEYEVEDPVAKRTG